MKLKNKLEILFIVTLGVGILLSVVGRTSKTMPSPTAESPTREMTTGYTQTNANGWPNPYSPQTNTAPTVGIGRDLTDHLRSVGFDEATIADISKDINGVPRPRGKWDVGAYQFPTTNVQVLPPPPVNLRMEKR